MTDPKTTLVDYLQQAREAMLWKLDGLSEYDARRPLTPTGTNLLGLVKHLAWVEAGYFGECFGRPFPEQPPFDFDDPDTDINADMVALPEESRDDVVALYRRVWAHAAQTWADLDLDAPGRVEWWGDDGDVTLHRLLVHMVAETSRHAGHADILRERLDGRAGRRPGDPNLDDSYDWGAHVARVEATAVAAQGGA